MLKGRWQYIVLKEELLGWREVPVVVLKDRPRAQPGSQPHERSLQMIRKAFMKLIDDTVLGKVVTIENSG